MKRYVCKRTRSPVRYSDRRGVIRFDQLVVIGRVRKTRSRWQRSMVHSIPILVSDYCCPAFYFTDLMRHRRKLDLDCGIPKVKNGIWRAQQFQTENI